MLYSLSHKFQQTFKFTFRQLKCNHIWYMFAVMNNFIADVRKGSNLLKSFEQSNLVNNMRSFTYKFWKSKVQHLHVQIVWWVIFIILFTRLLCDNSNSLITKGGKVQHFHVPAVRLYISCRLAFHSNNSNLNVWRPVSFCNQCLKKGSSLLRSNSF